MSTLNKCVNCGCEDKFLTTPPPCPTSVGCPTEECSNIQETKCTVYTGEIITCGEDTVVPLNTNLEAALNNIVDYFCTVTSNLPNFSSTVVAGNGIEVTSETVGNNITYTVSTTGIKKFVKEFTGIIFDNETVTIPGTELMECGLLSQACGVNTTKASDFTFNVMYLLDGVWIGLINERGVTVTANDITGDISVILDIAPIDPPVTLRVTVIG
jgi:hypothetical protein